MSRLVLWGYLEEVIGFCGDMGPIGAQSTMGKDMGPIGAQPTMGKDMSARIVRLHTKCIHFEFQAHNTSPRRPAQ